MQSLWSVLWSTGKSITFCPSEESPLTKTHSSTKAFLNESPTGIQSIDKPNLTSGTQQQRQHQKKNDTMVDWLESKHVRARNKHDTTNQCSSKFVESLSTMVGGTLNASRRNTFGARPSVPGINGRKRCRHQERGTGRTQKQFHVTAGPSKFQQRLKRNFSKAA